MFIHFRRTFFFAVLTLALLLTSCKSDCARLCARQQNCADTKGVNSKTHLHVDKRTELCVTFCETTVKDAKKGPAMEKALGCADKPCDSFQACMTTAAGD